MNILNTKAVAYGVAMLVGAGVLYVVARQLGGVIGAAAGAVGSAVNPADPRNLANRAVSSIGRSATGDPNWTLGGAIFDWLHGTYDPNARSAVDQHASNKPHQPGTSFETALAAWRSPTLPTERQTAFLLH